MKKKLFLLVFSLAFPYLNTVAQTPCVDGFAGEYPCSNYDLMSRIPVSILANTTGSPEGSDIWGWTDTTTGKEYAIAAMTNSTAFVDITDPLNPVFLGRLDSNAGSSFWRDVKVYKDFAFIVADNAGAHGMQVFDLKKLRGVTTPQNFTANTVYNTDNLGSCHNVFINENTGVAYLVGCTSGSSGIRLFSGGPVFVDVSNPENPTKIGGYADNGYSHDAQAITYKGPDTRYTDKEIYVGSNETKIVILDVTDKANVLKLAEISYANLGYTHQGWFTEDHRYFILGDETDEKGFGFNTRTLIFDFSNLEEPKLSSTYFGPTSAIDHNGYVKGNEYFLANYRAGFRVLDISNIGATPNAMTEVGYFDTFPTSNSADFNGVWSIYPYFESGNIIINDIERGLFVVRKSGTLATTSFEIDTNFNVFPNPVKNTNEVTIKTSENINSILLFNTLGQQILKITNTEQKNYTLNLSEVSKGMYIIKVNNLTPKKLIVN